MLARKPKTCQRLLIFTVLTLLCTMGSLYWNNENLDHPAQMCRFAWVFSFLIWARTQHFQQDFICAQRKLESPQADLSLRCPPWRRFGSLADGKTALRRLWSDCADVLADLSLRWAHMQSCRKCCAPALLWHNAWKHHIWSISLGFVSNYVKIETLRLIPTGVRNKLNTSNNNWIVKSENVLSRLSKYIENFTTKKWKFSDKYSDIFKFLLKT